MATDENNNQGNGSLIVCLIILGMCVSVMAYCGVRQMLDPPPHGPLEMSWDQKNYMRKVRQRHLERLWFTAQSKYSPPAMDDHPVGEP